MKTSNKLLITLAVLLILIPIIVLAVNVKLNYKDAESWAAEVKSKAHLKTASDGFIGSDISVPFNSVNIADAKGLFLSIRLIKDQKQGIKIPEELKNQISYRVDGQGILQILFNSSIKDNNRMASILIYSPDISQMSYAKGNGLDLTVNSDSLTLNASRSEHVAFSSDSRLNKLTMFADSIGEFSINNDIIGTLNLNLINSDFKTESASYKFLNIKALGNSAIEILGDESGKQKYAIDNLSIVTTGKSAVSLENIKVNKSAGSLSDSTTVSMPAGYLRQMFKN